MFMLRCSLSDHSKIIGLEFGSDFSEEMEI